MNFVDATLARLAHPATRAALFDESSLEQIVAAAYDVARLAPQGPYDAVFEELQIGFSGADSAIIDGYWNRLDNGVRTDARFRVAGFGGRRIRAEALWRGGIVARFSTSSDRVVDVDGGWQALGRIDEDVVADLGALPADPAALEQARRERFVSRVRGALDQPDLFGSEALDSWLEAQGANTLGHLLERAGTVHLGSLTLTYSPPSPAPASPRLLPLSAAILIRDQGFSLRELLVESKELLARLGDLGLERPSRTDLPTKSAALVVWMIPEAVFDDADWPGAAGGSAAARRSARRAVTGQWLGQEGIGVVALPEQ